MHAVDEPAIRRIAADLSRRWVEDCGIDTRCLYFDCTNFDTFIDSRTPSQLAQRGPAKSKRTDLRLIGLALLVSTDFNIPLFFQTYAGNQHHSVTFATVTEELVARYRLLAHNDEHITLVFDKGNNSQENLEKIAPGTYRVVGSLVPSQHSDLLAVPLRKFRTLHDPDLAGVSAHRTKKKSLAASGPSSSPAVRNY
jgi:transposase